jgi:transcriptional regulator with XRE-family HTH domain
MQVRSVRDLQVAARARRRELGMTQQQVAEAAGVSRKWLVGFEGGVASAVELSLVLRLFAILDIPLYVGDPSDTDSDTDSDTAAHLVDLKTHMVGLTALSPFSATTAPGSSA